MIRIDFLISKMIEDIEMSSIKLSTVNINKKIEKNK